MKKTIEYYKNLEFHKKKIKYYSIMTKAFVRNGMSQDNYFICMSSIGIMFLSILMLISKINGIYSIPILIIFFVACLNFIAVVILTLKIKEGNHDLIIQIITDENKEKTNNTLKLLDNASFFVFVSGCIFAFIFLFLIFI